LQPLAATLIAALRVMV